MNKNVKILGTNYKVQTNVPVSKDVRLYDNFGYCAFPEKRIVVVDLNTVDYLADESESFKIEIMKSTLRHEIIHAFLYESGLYSNSNGPKQWAMNEEMIDYFAIQFPKIVEVYKKVGCI